jgi:catecholate siderophore receptor
MNLHKLASIMIAMTMISLNAFTQEADDDVEELVIKGNVLQADQVAALKTPIAVINVPQTVSIFTDEEIKRQGFRQLGDIVRYTPGVNTSQGEGHRDAVVFRGVRSTADFFQDGLRDDVQYYRSLYNVEQVEILRGPNALLFGRGGTGGIINRVSKKAVIGEDFRNLDLGTDTFGAFDLAADVNLSTGTNSALRLNLHTDSLANHRDFYEGERFGINPTLRVILDDQTTVDLSYEYADHERFIDRGIPTLNGVPAEGLKDIVFGEEGVNIQTLEASIFRGNLEHRINSSQKAVVSFQSSSYEKFYQNYYASGYDGTLVTMDGYSDPTERDNTMFSANLINEFDVPFLNGSAKHTLMVGAEAISTDNKNFRYNTFWSTTLDDNEVFNVTNPMNFSVNANGDATTNDFTADLNNSTTSAISVTSVYVQDQIDLTDNFKVMLGFRHDNFDISVTDVIANNTTSKVDENVSPRLGLIYKPMEDMSVYYSYSESFLPRSGEQFKKLKESDSRLDADVFESTEFGLKLSLSNNLSLTASLFESEQVRAERDSDTGETSEVIGLTVEGFEVELKGQLSDNLSIHAGYSSLDGVTAKGGKPREIPTHTFNAFAQYIVSENFGWGIGFTQQGESYIKNDDTSKVLPEYTRIDFSAYYDVSDDVSIRMNIENVGDEVYFPHSHSSHQVTVGESVNARFSVTRRF